MDGQLEGAEPQGDEVEAHLIKEAAVTVAAAGALFAGSAQARPVNPDPGSDVRVTQTQGGYTVTTVAPSGYNNKQVQISVSFNATGTFAQILGFNAINIQATATAEAGTNAKTYAVFAYGGIGTGNTINAQMSGVGQVDNGQEGNDFCSFSTAGITISNAKFHIPT